MREALRLRRFVHVITERLDRGDAELALLAGASDPMRELVSVDDWLPEGMASPQPQYYQQYMGRKAPRLHRPLRPRKRVRGRELVKERGVAGQAARDLDGYKNVLRSPHSRLNAFLLRVVERPQLRMSLVAIPSNLDLEFLRGNPVGGNRFARVHVSHAERSFNAVAVHA